MVRYYENPLKTSENRLKCRSYYIPENSRILLNGSWKFYYNQNGDSIDPNGKIKKWGKIQVPSTWQNSGVESPNYTNYRYPFSVDMPYVPNINPIGIYEREFTLTKANYKSYIVLEGVSSLAEVYINGKYVGFTEGSRLFAEFDITNYVFVGKNTVRIAVRKWCSGSYLEDQDQFRCHGIFRDIYILERPQNHLVDFNITTKENTAVFTTDSDVLVTLFDGEAEIGKATTNQNGIAEIKVKNPTFWNAEKPYLYGVKFEKSGETVFRKFGFRTITVSKDKAILINGTAVKFKGVNHHDTTIKGGWTITKEQMLEDLLLMKSLNINTIRTSHYPPAPEFLDLCDELGFYVVLEADIETHGFATRYAGYQYDSHRNTEWPTANPDWKNEFLSRICRTYNRDKYHTCIFMWSTCNESDHGENKDAMIEYLRSQDSSRLIHDETVSRKWESMYLELNDAKEKYYLLKGKGESTKQAEAEVAKLQKEYDKYTKIAHSVDVYSRMYPEIADIESWCKSEWNDMPVFLCEYAHAMGNGPGCVWDYMELVYKYPQYTGGCIWEWADHAVNENGVLKYGGDFKDEPNNDGNFCCDGMVFANRELKPGSLEIKAAYAPFRTSYKNGTITVKNCCDFTNLNEFDITYTVFCDGKIIKTETVKKDLAPHKSDVLCTLQDLPKNCKYGAYVMVTLTNAKGETVGSVQHKTEATEENLCALKAPMNITKDGIYAYASGKNFKYRFNTQLGTIDSLKIKGKEMLLTPFKITSYIAPTDNDMFMKHNWYDVNGENLAKPCTHIYSTEIIGNTITFAGSVAGMTKSPYFNFVLSISVDQIGTLAFNLNGKIRESCPYLPKLGFDFALKQKNAEFTYFGMGPYENYPDSFHHTTVNFYKSSANKEYVNYIRPQEHGNHTNTRVLEFNNGIKIYGKSTFNFHVLGYNTEQLAKAEHTNELEYLNGTFVRIDYKVSGLGTNSCGPLTLEKYRLAEKDIAFKFSIAIQ